MSPKILIVDDSASMRATIQFILGQAGFATDQARDGLEALKLLDDSHALMLLDFNMPGMSGLEVCRKVRQGTVNARIPIVLVTTETDSSQKAAVREAGATAWVSKPFEPDLLVQVVRKFTQELRF